MKDSDSISKKSSSDSENLVNNTVPEMPKDKRTKAYKEWVKSNLGTVPLHINPFSQQLKKLGFELGKSGSQRHVKGLCIK